jgi:hypothetical protein
MKEKAWHMIIPYVESTWNDKINSNICRNSKILEQYTLDTIRRQRKNVKSIKTLKYTKDEVTNLRKKNQSLLSQLQQNSMYMTLFRRIELACNTDKQN